MSATATQNHPSFEELFKDLNMVPLALFEHIDLSFLEEFQCSPLTHGANTGT